MNEKTEKSFEKSFEITKEDIDAHSKVLSLELQKSFDNLEKLNSNIIGGVPSDFYLEARDILKESMFNNEIMSNEDNSRLSVIYHLCLSKLMDFTLSWAEYKLYLPVMFNSFLIKNPESNVEASILNHFKVDPQIIPKKHKSKIAFDIEHEKAIDFIKSKIYLLNIRNSECYSDYDSYYNYIKGKSYDLIEDMAKEGFTLCESIDNFSLGLISIINNLPMLSRLYKNPLQDNNLDIPIDQIKKVHKKILYDEE